MRKLFKRKRLGDRGSGILETVAGLALGTMIIGGGAAIYVQSSQTAATAKVIESQNTDISQALDRLSQNIKVSNPILVAGPDELVIQSSEDDTTTVANRWVRNTDTLYRQVWSGQATAYPFGSSAWISTGMATGTAPNGDGKQDTSTVVERLTAETPVVPVFRYFDEAGTEIPVPAAGITAQNGDTAKIRRVDALVTADTARGGTVQNRISASPRNTTGGVSAAGDAVAPVCPAVTLQTSGGRPDVRWATITGSTTYHVYRNNALATTVTTAAGSTQGSWVDNTVSIAGDDAIVYKVLAQDGAGNVSPTSCRPQTWRAQIDAPVIKGLQVLPAADKATDWTSGPDSSLGLKKPKITAAWDAVSGASGYTLLVREYDAATSLPIEPSFRPAAVLDSSTLSFSWTEAGWGKYYAWKIRAESRSGQSVDSPVVYSLTHPMAPKNIKIAPAYGEGSDKAVNGYNNISWDAVAGASGYDVYRYNSGTSGAVTLLGSTTTTSYKDTVPYGSTYSYYVATKNTGLRGTAGSKTQSSPNPETGAQAATGTFPTVSFTGGGTGGGSASMAVGGVIPLAVPAATDPNDPAPVVATQLMYPPIPTVKAVSAAAGAQTRDLDGANVVVWDPAPSATGYQAAKFTPGGAVSTCLTSACSGGSAGGITATQLSDPAAKGTQTDYAVLAYNATGPSVEFSAKVRLTQRPPAPTLTMTRAPSLATSTSDFQISQNADQGNTGSDKFCTATTCRYDLVRNGSTLLTTNHSQSGAVMDWKNAPNPEGATLSYSSRSKNEAVTNGGWSDLSPAQTVLTYPGDFAYNLWVGDHDGNQRERVVLDKWNVDNAGASQWIQAGATTVEWGPSAGASYVNWVRRADTAEATSSDWTRILPGAQNLSSNGPANGGYQQDWASPGTVYHFDLKAVAPNGLERSKTTGQIGTPAEMPHHGLLQTVCSGNTTSPWWQDNGAHYIGARLIDFWPAIKYGSWDRVRVHGLFLPKGQGYYNASNVVEMPHEAWAADGWWATITSGSGYGYYYGISNGFDIFTKGSVGPNSAGLRMTIETLGTFDSGCGAQWATWGGLQEPTVPCYGYVPGEPCQTPNYQNRPQWIGR